MKKRLLCIFAILSMILSSNFAFAVDVSTKEDSDIELMYEQVMNMSAGLSISSFGQATCSGFASVHPGYNIRMTIELLKMENYSWKSIKSWVHTGSGVVGVNASDTYWVDHGTYTTKITVYVTDSNGNYIESPSTTSVIKEY
ncbi:hypothetical protein RX717_00815 [Intestinibacillus sp. NTUH-41-i26]|uniref:hypothetical protein n=1 Tax=Butyricicoccaceae TaxID=3085642 RepID=UPI000D1EE171|nr:MULTISPECIES: hypothetical protein [Butyricicoccaceae]WOC75569.1 hypothetical protein RX717_00815 [Intestinibacillus sp. NTUH-41-i26]